MVFWMVESRSKFVRLLLLLLSFQHQIAPFALVDNEVIGRVDGPYRFGGVRSAERDDKIAAVRILLEVRVFIIGNIDVIAVPIFADGRAGFPSAECLK